MERISSKNENTNTFDSTNNSDLNNDDVPFSSVWNFIQPHSATQSFKGWASSIKTVGSVSSAAELMYCIDEFTNNESMRLNNIMDLYFFREGCLPIAETDENKNGGRIIIEVLKVNNSDTRILEYLKKTLVFATCEFYSSICGVAYNLKEKTYRLCIWIGDSEQSEEILNSWKKLLLSSFASFTYAPHRKYQTSPSPNMVMKKRKY